MTRWPWRLRPPGLLSTPLIHLPCHTSENARLNCHSLEFYPQILRKTHKQWSERVHIERANPLLGKLILGLADVSTGLTVPVSTILVIPSDGYDAVRKLTESPIELKLLEACIKKRSVFPPPVPQVVSVRRKMCFGLEFTGDCAKMLLEG